MAYHETIAVDIGYGYVKAISSNGKRVLFPAIVGSGRERNLGNIMGATGSEVGIDLSDLHVKLNGKHYFIGENAERNSSDRSRIFERERYKHPYTNILLHVAIQLVASPETERVTLYTGLPFTDFQIQAQSFQSQLNSEDTPTVEWMSGYTTGCRKIEIDHALVFPQAMSSILSTVINHEGKLIHSDVITAGHQIAVIDIGYRTTDICVVEMQGDGAFIPLMKYSGTIDQGVVNLKENIKKQYQDKTGASDLSDSKADRILKHKFLRYKGHKMDFSSEVEEAYQVVAHSINDKVKTIWKDEADTFDYIFVVGGGGIIFSRYFQENYNHRLKNIVDTQFANAIGYYRLGKLIEGETTQKQMAN